MKKIIDRIPSVMVIGLLFAWNPVKDELYGTEQQGHWNVTSYPSGATFLSICVLYCLAKRNVWYITCIWYHSSQFYRKISIFLITILYSYCIMVTVYSINKTLSTRTSLRRWLFWIQYIFNNNLALLGFDISRIYSKIMMFVCSQNLFWHPYSLFFNSVLK